MSDPRQSASKTTGYAGPWHDGRRLVIAPAYGTKLPARCVRCNAAAVRSLTQPLPVPKSERGVLGHGKLAAAGGLAWLIEAKRVPFAYSLCARHATFTPHRIGMLSGASGLVLMLAGITWMLSSKGAWPSMVTLALAAGLLVVMAIATLKTPTIESCDGEFILVGGCGRVFLESFPKFTVRAARELTSQQKPAK